MCRYEPNADGAVGSRQFEGASSPVVTWIGEVLLHGGWIRICLCCCLGLLFPSHDSSLDSLLAVRYLTARALQSAFSSQRALRPEK